MFSSAYHTFYYVSLFMSMIVSCFLLTRTDPVFRWLAVLVMVAFVNELLAEYLPRLKVNRNAVYHCYTLVEYILYAQFYQKLFAEKRWSRFIGATVLFLFLAEVLNVIFFQGLDASNTNTLILENLLLVFLSLNLFNKLMELVPEGNILYEGVFWFNSAVLFYYAFNILIWSFHSIRVYQLKDPPLFIYYFNLLLSGLLYIVFSLALLLNVRAKKLQYE